MSDLQAINKKHQIISFSPAIASFGLNVLFFYFWRALSEISKCAPKLILYSKCAECSKLFNDAQIIRINSTEKNAGFFFEKVHH